MTDTEGRYIVARHWGRWSVQDQSWNPPRILGRPYPTKAQADAAADRLNHPPRPARQDTLFDAQEAAG